MKKFIKKFALIILSVVAAACACAGLSACSKGGSDNGGNGDTDSENTGSLYGKWDEYECVKVAFADKATYNEGDIDESKVLPELNCKLGEKQYMIIDFDIQAPYDNDGRESVTVAAQLQPTAAIRATIQEAQTGTVSEETVDDVTEIKATYKIPEKAETVRSMRLVIQVEAKDRSLANLDLAFENSGDMQGVKTSKVEKSVVMGYTEELTIKNGTVTGISDKTVEEIVIPNYYEGKSVTDIASLAFKDLHSVKTIVIPKSVTSIGGIGFRECNVFLNCNNLGKIIVDKHNKSFVSKDGILYYKKDIWHVPKSIKGIVHILDGVSRIGCTASIVSEAGSYYKGFNSFKGCEYLTDVIIPDGAESIGYGAFEGCIGLTSVTIPNSVTDIGGSAFSGCCNLQYSDNGNALYLGNELNKFLVLIKAKNNDITSCEISDEAKFIYGGAFSDCNELTSVLMGNGVIKIGDEAFKDCSKLTRITIPNNVVDIGDSAFSGCRGLTSVKLGNGVTSIGSKVFFNCSGLTSIDTENATSIGYGAFSGCNGLTSIKFDSLTHISYEAFKGCSKLTNLTLPNSVTSIGDSAFSDCSKLTNLIIPKSVKSIGKYSFSGCSGLTSVKISGGETNIGYSAFSGCNSLESINLPFAVSTVENGSDTYEYPFGYIFGNKEYLGTIATKQLYHGYSTEDETTTYFSSSITYYIPMSLTSVTVTGNNIQTLAFYNCNYLKNITISNTVKIIGQSALSGCSSLTSITFNGTKEKWEVIKKGTTWNDNTGNYTVHCTDGDLTKAEAG